MVKKVLQTEFLYIQEGEKTHLPKRFVKVNNICAILYDQLTEIFTTENYGPLTHTEINHPEIEKVIKELEKENIHILDWLKKNGKKEDITQVLTKHLLMSITSDFLAFIYESLRCAKNGKMTVAYALLRKPLTDELLILEQLLIDRDDFVHRFFVDGRTKGYDPSPANKKVDKQSVIESAVSKLYLNPVLVADYIHEVRYDKACGFGLNGLTNQALHIVTNDFHYRTEEQNLNFVFSIEEDIKNYREHYYTIVPYLLIYAISVIDGVVFDLLKDDENQDIRYVKALRRLTGFFLINKHSKTIDGGTIEGLFKIIGEGMPKDCQSCGHENTIELADFELFFETEVFVCEKCFDNLLATKESVKTIREFFSGFRKDGEG
ncbi:MAG: hypothetical protein HKN52_05325 [Eudoraea sp.]|nr:hypothetical protein [Eudoraea sp.]NNK55551.1 hypothetical protein [Flavobacteriaceae bacterium]